MKKYIYIIFILTVQNAFSQDVKDIKFTFGTEVYYAYDFNEPVNKELPGFLYSHSRHNEISINQMYLKGSYDGDRTRAAASLIFGDYQSRNYSAEPEYLRHLFEARAGYMFLDSLWLDAGVFPSHIGFESTIANENWTATHSIVAHNSPFYESGAKLTYNRGGWLFSILILNGWQVIRDNNSNKGIGTQIQFKPAGNILLNSSAYIGEGYNLPDSLSRTRYFHDFYAVIDWSSFLSTAVSFDYGWQEVAVDRTKNWWGISGIVKCNINSALSFAGRAEYYNDPDNLIITAPAGFKTAGYSLNCDYKAADHIIFRIEGKLYNSDNKIFPEEDGFTGTLSILTLSLSFKM